jgi:histidine triad (HIT) family protein
MPDCLFCKIASGVIPAEVIFQDESVLAFRDINPKAPTHVLVIPRTHIPTINDIGSDDTDLIGRLYLAAKKIASDAGIAQRGYRTVMNCNAEAGQTVYHLHLHVLGGRAMHWPPG